MSLESLGLEIRLATDEELRAAGLYMNSTVMALGILPDGTLAGVAQFNSAYRGKDCSACTTRCWRGGLIWTRPDMRRQGVFTALVEWVIEQQNAFPIYTSTTSPQQRLLVRRYGEQYGLRTPVDAEPIGNRQAIQADIEPKIRLLEEAVRNG